MKKLLAAVIAFVMIFSLSSCSQKGNNNKELNQIVASYSIKSDENNFIVEVQKLGGVYDELYDEDGLYIKLAKDAKIFDADEKEITVDDLFVGNTLVISYDGTLSKKNPKTIKAYEIKRIA